MGHQADVRGVGMPHALLQATSYWMPVAVHAADEASRPAADVSTQRPAGVAPTRGCGQADFHKSGFGFRGPPSTHRPRAASEGSQS